MTTFDKKLLPNLNLPENFVWGAATASYQIEGAIQADGKSPSIWDDFCATPGKIHDGTSGEIAIDHYHRWQNDLDLMQQMHLQAYRFSVAWTRILPNGTGQTNTKGIGFYDQLIDGLLARKITPYLTLFHWDLPSVLHHQGGWQNRDAIHWFGEYAQVLAKHYGDRVKNWMTINEPNIHAANGYLTGDHAPGIADVKAFFETSHHLNCAHGAAVRAIREEVTDSKIGLVLHLQVIEPVTEADSEAAVLVDDSFHKMYLDGTIKGTYPESVQYMMDQNQIDIAENDMQLMSPTVDFVGVNHYTRYFVRSMPEAPTGAMIDMDYRNPDSDYTNIGWEIYPEGFTSVLMRIKNDYNLPVVVTENGCTRDDELVIEQGKKAVHDLERLDFYACYIQAMQIAVDQGCDVQGYFAWTLTDNFEWAEGLSMRFGLIYVDYESLERTLKDSAIWYSQLIQEYA